MSLPGLESAQDAEPTIAAVVHDAKIRQLRKAFSRDGGLTEIIEHAEKVLANLESDVEQSQLQRIIERWTRLLAAGRVHGERVDRVAALVSDASSWDLRIGAERDAMPTSVELFPTDTADLIMSIAHDWKMTSAPTPHGPFTVVMPIGGLLRANLARPAYAADLLARGLITAEMVVALASERRTSPEERERARALDAPEGSEQAALAFGMERAFGFGPGDWSPTEAPGVMQAPDHDGVGLFMGAAPANQVLGRRATTGEAFAWLLATALLPDNSSILQITATHCRLANHVALLTTAPTTMRVQTVGRPVMTGGPVRSQHYLQEMKAFVDYLPGLRTWATRRPVTSAENVTRLEEVSPMHTLSIPGSPVSSRSRD